MREIKFRAWGHLPRKNYKIFYNFAMDMFYGIYLPVIGGENICDHSFMQFTGLLDKNGKEIYEGDIVKYGKFALNDTKKYGENSWHNLPAGVNDDDISTVIGVFEINFTPKGLTSIDSMINNNPDVFGVEIIGNIYENPELLT